MPKIFHIPAIAIISGLSLWWPQPKLNQKTTTIHYHPSLVCFYLFHLKTGCCIQQSGMSLWMLFKKFIKTRQYIIPLSFIRHIINILANCFQVNPFLPCFLVRASLCWWYYILYLESCRYVCILKWYHVHLNLF